MSPRAACRLERLGYQPVYDYVAGKADWLAAGLPTEGRPHRGRALDVADRDPPICTPDETVADVARRLAASGASSCVVIDPSRVVLGRLRLDRVAANADTLVEDVMEPGPTTIRADADTGETRARMARRGVTSLLVTTPEGVLLGELLEDDGFETPG